jgi:hypothetical protein
MSFQPGFGSIIAYRPVLTSLELATAPDCFITHRSVLHLQQHDLGNAARILVVYDDRPGGQAFLVTASSRPKRLRD